MTNRNEMDQEMIENAINTKTHFRMKINRAKNRFKFFARIQHSTAYQKTYLLLLGQIAFCSNITASGNATNGSRLIATCENLALRIEKTAAQVYKSTMHKIRQTKGTRTNDYHNRAKNSGTVDSLNRINHDSWCPSVGRR